MPAPHRCPTPTPAPRHRALYLQPGRGRAQVRLLPSRLKHEIKKLRRATQPPPGRLEYRHRSSCSAKPDPSKPITNQPQILSKPNPVTQSSNGVHQVRFKELRDVDGTILAQGLHPAIAVVAANGAARAAVISAAFSTGSGKIISCFRRRAPAAARHCDSRGTACRFGRPQAGAGRRGRTGSQGGRRRGAARHP